MPRQLVTVGGPIDAAGEFRRLRCALRERHELRPLVMLAPGIHLAVVRDVVALLPVIADGREVCRMWRETRRPQVQIDRRARGPIRDAAERDTAICRSVVLA